MQDSPSLMEVVLGALLHDIGKFMQRTGQKQYQSTYEELLCPYNQKQNYFSHRHVLFTDGFLTAHKDLFPRSINSSFVVNLAAKHHKPDTTFEWLVTVADWLSSGTDRRHTENDEQASKYYEQPLKSIFTKIKLRDEEPAADRFHNLEKLSVAATKPLEHIKLGRAEYEKFWSDFEIDLLKLKGTNYKEEDFLGLLLNILLHYTWAIPSTTMDEPDISLYDHLLTTAAIAAVLFRYHQTDRTLDDLEKIKNRSINKYLFVSGDVSGIQDYIFHSSETKAKILRAKSFEIQALSKAVSTRILRSLELPQVCKIMDAGGRFLLLLPNTEDIKSKLCELRIEIEAWTVEKYFGQLTINISDGLEASGHELDQNNTRKLFAAIAEKTAETKQTKLQSWLVDNNHVLEFGYKSITSNQDVCNCCKKRVREQGSENCSDCNSLLSFGKNIPKNKYLAWLEQDTAAGLSFFGDVQLAGFKDLKDIPEGSLPIAINQFNPLFTTMYTPYYLPLKDNGREVMEFEEIATHAEGKQYLAMLKADVDNLGYIFSNGMGERISISRFAALSRMLDFYFSAVVHHLLQNKYPQLYMVFSGGDDLCLIGPWDKVFNFVKDFQSEFSRYVGANASITISCGIALAGPRLPVHNMARQAEVAEKEAKKKKPGKIHAFGVTASAESFEELLQASNDLTKMMQKTDNEKITSGMVYRLLDYGRKEKAVLDGEITNANVMWRSHFFYDSARNVDKKIVNEFRGLVNKHIKDMNFIASYALYKNRKQEVRS